MKANTQIDNYIQTRQTISRIEKLLGGDWDTRYCLEKIVPTLWADGFEAEDIQNYLTIKLYETIDKLEEEKEIITKDNQDDKTPYQKRIEEINK
tara:strand:+ start:71 stop:352 length:282 start_codon:yes stop_codon:yes gene_type:complete